MFTKGQLRISESMVVIFVFFILLLFGLGFYVKELKSGINNSLREEKDFSNLLLISSLINSPEFSCSKDTVVESGCFDMKKVDSFVNLIVKDDYKEFYEILFGNSVIRVKGVYPDSFSYNKEVYNNAKLDYDLKIVRGVPVSLYNPDNNGYFIGLLKVEVYE